MFCALTGLVTQALFNICYNTAIATIGMSVSAVLLYVAPVVTAVSAALIFSEKITRKKAIALLVNVLGCVLTVTGGSLNAGNLVLSGVLVPESATEWWRSWEGSPRRKSIRSWP